MVFGPTVQFICQKCSATYGVDEKCRCPVNKTVFGAVISGTSTEPIETTSTRDLNRKIKNLEFELERAKIDLGESRRCEHEAELLYAAEKEKLRFFEAALLRVKNMTVEELLKSFNGLSDKPSEEGMNFSLLEIE
jgi:hypothetical protein